MKMCINPNHGMRNKTIVKTDPDTKETKVEVIKVRQHYGMMDGILTKDEIKQGHVFCLRCRGQGHDEKKYLELIKNRT